MTNLLSPRAYRGNHESRAGRWTIMLVVTFGVEASIMALLPSFVSEDAHWWIGGAIDSALIAGVAGLLAFLLFVRPVARAANSYSALASVALESSDDCVIIVDADGVIRTCTSASITLFGVSSEELTNRPLLEALPEVCGAASGKDHTRLLRDFARVGRRELVLRHAGGNKHVVAKVTAIKEPFRNWHMLRFIDITERRTMQEAVRNVFETTVGLSDEAFFQRLVLSLGQSFPARCVFLAELVEGRGSDVRALTVSVDGMPAESFEFDPSNTVIEKVLQAEDGIFACASCSDSLTTLPPLFDMAESFLGIRLEGDDGEPCGVLAIIDDVPRSFDGSSVGIARLFALQAQAELAQRLNRIALQRANERLAESCDELRAAREMAEQRAAELRRLNHELEEAVKEARAASVSKSQFLASMSHEIRTPMTAILGYADILLHEGDPSKAPPERINALTVIKRNGEHLLTLINDILDLSKLEAGSMSIEHVEMSLPQLVDDVGNLFRKKAQDKGLRLVVEQVGMVPEFIHSDVVRLRQVLVNLVGNAVKFTNEGEVRISYRFVPGDAEHRDGRAILTVSDTGIGMTGEQAAKVFDAFTQADNSTTRKFGGTGLGLAISKGLVEALGGTITVDSEPGAGATFTFDVPTGEINGVRMLSPEEAKLATRATVESLSNSGESDMPDIEGVRVLLVEDGPDNQRLISHVLKKAGAVVTCAENGKEAVETLSADGTVDGPLKDPPLFDIVLMDMQMPVMDGLTAVGLLREKGFQLPIVALTAHSFEEERQECIAGGCDDFSTKPIDRHRLFATIHKWTVGLAAGSAMA